jgi:hypothetical protein
MGGSIAAALDALKRARRISWNLYFHSLVRPPSIPPGLPGIPTLDDVRQALFVEAIEQTAPGLLATLEALCAPFATGSATATQLRAFAGQFALIDAAKMSSELQPASAPAHTMTPSQAGQGEAGLRNECRKEGLRCMCTPSLIPSAQSPHPFGLDARRDEEAH